MAYVTIQAVLEEAGLWHRELDEEPAGAVNGSNTIFTVAHKPLADNNYDDSVTVLDVSLYVNGTAVTVGSVNSVTGAITAAVAPAADAEVSVDYSYSNVSTTFVSDVIAEASEIIDNELSQVASTPFAGTVPKTVRLIARTLAAGLLLAREYGLQADEEASKAARAKIKQAEAWLASYKTRTSDTSTDSSEAVPSSSADRRIFQTYDESEAIWEPLADENITINEVL